MRRLLIGLLFFIYHSLSMAQTLEACQMAAERNYPLIRQYDLITRTTELTVANIQKGWLPQVSAYVQATLQSDVTAFPESMQTLYQQVGINMEGLRKDQYRVNIDVQQIVYDGGLIRSQKEISRKQGKVQSAQAEVALYQVRQRVNELYFGLLLIDKRLQLNLDMQEVLAGNERKLESMYKNGTASESDYLSVKAERLYVTQENTELEAQRRTLERILSTFCGMDAIKTVKPDEAASLAGMHMGQQRPELKVIDAQLRLADAQEKALDAALKPKLGLFAQGFYGYPGLNMFEDMMRRQCSLNGILGARLSWNIGALYTRKGDQTKILLQRGMAETNRDVFLFNNNLEQIQQNEGIGRCRRLMADDEEIVSLRSSVRKAAESKLAHGIIDVNDLVKEIHAENHARLQQSMHEIELLKAIYDLKVTTNQ